MTPEQVVALLTVIANQQLVINDLLAQRAQLLAQLGQPEPEAQATAKQGA